MTMNEVILQVFLGIAFGGWSLYLTSERGRIVSDIKKLQQEQNDQDKRLTATDHVLANNYMTKSDHSHFEDRMVDAINKLSERIDKLIMGRQG